jgi:exodeoxyribonuclease VII large subunit
VDVIILARGGGSLEDLWAFNEEIVARAIAASHIPVISAVGHEVDFSIADFVADLRAPTPSAAAEHAVPDQSAWLNRFTAIERQLTRQIQDKLQQQQLRLTWLNKALQTQHPGEKLQRNAQRLDELEQRLNRAIQNSLQQHRQQLALNKHRLYLHQPLAAIHDYRRQLDYFQQRLSRSMQIKITTLKSRQQAAAQTLHAVSPLATLERGYAIVQRRDSSQLIKSVKQLTKHELLDTRFADGRIVSEVKQVFPD